jgi:Bacterial HORMA domain family 1
MTFSYTQSATFTRTHARYLASKVAGDLRQMQVFYGRPSDEEIDVYLEELTELLVGRYLQSVEYGFRRAGGTIVAVSYEVRSDGSLTTDDRSGRVPVGVDVSGATWYSYLRPSSEWWLLSTADRNQIEQSLPIQRTPGAEPQAGDGVWVEDKVYSCSGMALPRRVFRPR